MIDMKTVFLAQQMVGTGIERFIYEAHLYFETRISLSEISMIIGDLHYNGETDSDIMEDYVIEILAERAVPLYLTDQDGGDNGTEERDLS